MANTDDDRRPKYQRIADSLREAIQSGEYGPGDRLPGENELMAAHGVARMTARQALSVLRDEGVAEARKGAGVFVRAFRPLRRRGIQRLSQQQWGSGRSIWSADIENRALEVDQVTVSEEAAPDRISAVLELADDETVCVRRRRFVLEGKPVLLATSYLPHQWLPDPPSRRRTRDPAGRTPGLPNSATSLCTSARRSAHACRRRMRRHS